MDNGECIFLRVKKIEKSRVPSLETGEPVLIRLFERAYRFQIPYAG